MGRIRYVVVSDMHAGAVLSLATAVDSNANPTDPTIPSPTAAAFGAALRALLRRNRPAARPEIVLLGDIMDLAFCGRDQAAQSYAGWLTAVLGDDPALFAPDMILLPGNHDHSLWTAARLAAETASVVAGGAAEMPLCTPMITGAALPATMVTALNRRAGMTGAVQIRYPNFAIHDKTSGRCVVFHHGHFLEATYRAMSMAHDMLTGVPRPHLTAAQLADENANWIDFGWSSFGQASDLSRDVMMLYSDLAVSSEAHHLRQRLARGIANSLGPKLPMAGQSNMKSMLRHGVLAALDVSFGKFSDEERASISTVMSDSGIAGLHAYINGPVFGQLRAELGHIPPELTFVFGHTHKPFMDTVVPDTGPVVQVCNTGGWYLDSPRLNGREGVSLVLVDDALNVVAVQCFATPVNGAPCPVTVRLASHYSADGAAFADEIAAHVAADAALWDNLAQVAAQEYDIRRNLILSLLARSDHAAHDHGGVI